MINGNIYNVDYSALLIHLKPSLLRKPKLRAMLSALISPVVTLYVEFLIFKNQAIYKTQHNASIILLQKVLNDAFDNETRGIYIDNALLLDSEHYYNPEKGDPFNFFNDLEGLPIYHMNPEGYNVYGSDFTVFLPAAIRPDIYWGEEERLLVKIRAALDYYKLYGTKYTIVWLN